MEYCKYCSDYIDTSGGKVLAQKHGYKMLLLDGKIHVIVLRKQMLDKAIRRDEMLRRGLQLPAFEKPRTQMEEPEDVQAPNI